MGVLFAVCGIYIVFDVVCGIVGALRNKVLSSSVMREGLFNKCGELMLLGFAVLCYYVLNLDEFAGIGIPPEIAYAVAVYIVVMESVSILENICKINPDLPFAKLLAMFNIDVDKDVQDTVESEAASEK